MTRPATFPPGKAALNPHIKVISFFQVLSLLTRKPSRLPPKEFTLYSSDPGKSILTDWYGWDGAKHFGWGAAFNVTTVQDAVKQATLYAEMHHNAKTPIPLPSLDEHKEHLFTWHSNVDGGGDYKLVVKYGMTWYELALISGIISNFCEKYTWEGKVPGFSFLAYDDDEAEAIARGLFYDVGMPPAPRAVQ